MLENLLGAIQKEREITFTLSLAEGNGDPILVQTCA
jgi:hypothetical protein